MESFYTCSTPEIKGDIWTCKMVILANHPAFQGHFPDFPVFPGAFLLTIVKDVLEEHLNARLQLREASDIKFLAMLPMHQDQEVTLKIQLQEGEILNVKAWLESQEKTYCKMAGEFKFLN